ncbi:hypothetical protein CEXT_318761 [Caerostris extrusa]|uniref:Nuclear nucleic acid-binding protein C1D n=1 Tax=Caerostris extrusa TaxID=172846 RepID=A0AAV4MK47_CAEEX|nr:hypothetical protein CEXT_318761 [Caerostris extrusa]
MDTSISEGTPSINNVIKKLPNNNNELMTVALQHFKDILNLTDIRDLKQAFRVSALSLVTIISHQSFLLAQMKGRMIEMEKNLNERLLSAKQNPPKDIPLRKNYHSRE